MYDKNSDEIAAVIALCENGKITPAQRDSLIAALTERSRSERADGAENDADGFDEFDEFDDLDDEFDELEEDLEDMDDDLFEDDDDDDDEDEEPENKSKFEIHIDDEDTFAQMLSGIGVKIADIARDGAKIAGKAGVKIEKAVKDALDGLDIKLGGGDRGTVTVNGDEVIRCAPEEYDEPYEALTMSVKYSDGKKSAFRMTLSCAMAEDIRRAAREVMTDSAYGRFSELLDSRFVGKYKYACGKIALYVKVGK